MPKSECVKKYITCLNSEPNLFTCRVEIYSYHQIRKTQFLCNPCIYQADSGGAEGWKKLKAEAICKGSSLNVAARRGGGNSSPGSQSGKSFWRKLVRGLDPEYLRPCFLTPKGKQSSTQSMQGGGSLRTTAGYKHNSGFALPPCQKDRWWNCTWLWSLAICCW